MALLRDHDSKGMDRRCILCLFMSMSAKSVARGLNFVGTWTIAIAGLSALSAARSPRRELSLCFVLRPPV